MFGAILKTTPFRSALQAFALAVMACGTALADSARSTTHADTVQGVFWDQSFLVRSGPGRWEERKASGAELAFTFEEVYGNASEIILNDASRDVDLRIDLTRMAIDYADAQNPSFRPLYTLDGFIDTAGRQVFSPERTAPAPSTAPDLGTVWNSDFGPIHWQEGFYGNPTKILKGSLRSHGGPQYVFEGFWARTNAPARGSVLFVFSADGQRFEGTYTASDGSTKTWNGFR